MKFSVNGLQILCLALLAMSNIAGAQSWSPLQHQPCSPGQPCFSPGTALLLTDGTVFVQGTFTGNWYRLTPDDSGSYVNGTWSQAASLPAGYGPLYFASAVLPDGRVIVEGGEDNYGASPLASTTLGAIYSPISDEWTQVPPPHGWCCISDAQSAVLANGQFMLANAYTEQEALLNATTLTWTPTGRGKADINDEEGWTLLPNKQVLTVDARNGTNSEVYIPASGIWQSAGSTIVPLAAGLEMGPAVLRPDGTVFATGASEHTAIYDSSTGTWSVGPDFPVSAQGQLSIGDGPAALLINGNVLCAASSSAGPPSYFFEFDGTSLNPVDGPPETSVELPFESRMLVLPTGQIFFVGATTNIEIYTPSGTYNPDWAPRIQKYPASVSPGGSYVVEGHHFNGLSQGAAYGDDAQSATNYPLVRITNLSTGHVFYSRTHDHSSMAVAFGGLVSTHFDVPAGQETGPSSLVVVANGIPSEPVAINVDQ